MKRLAAMTTLLVGLGIFALLKSGTGLEASDSVPDPASRFGLQRSFDEEFDSGPLDRSSWRTTYGPGPDTRMTIARRSLATNRERQVYVAPEYLGLGLDPFAISDGRLQITARPLEPAARAAMMKELASLPQKQRESPLKDVRYASGLITTKGTFRQQYGYFEARMRWTGGRGIWPAFWLLPDDDSWPPEIDIMEALGDQPRTAYQTRHWAPGKSQGHAARIPGGDPSQFHVYGALWTPGALIFFIDNVPTVRFVPPPGSDKPMYMLVNLAIGGYWPKDPNEQTHFPARLDVDWIRAWKLPKDWDDTKLDSLGLAVTPSK